MSQVPPSRRVLALSFALVLVAASCGSSAEDDTSGVATLSDGDEDAGAVDDPDTGDTPTAEAPEDPEEAFALFSECMDEAGFGMAGSVTTGGSDGAIGVDAGLTVEEVDPQGEAFDFEDVDFEAFEEANSECEAHLANIGMGFDLTPEEQVLFDDAQLDFAECMEEHGVKMPEVSGGGGAITIVGEPDVDPQTGEVSFDDAGFDFESFNEASQECEHHLAELDALLAGEGEGE